MTYHLIIHLCVGWLLILVALPLVLGWVPMNRWYGVKLPKAYVSDENWIALNAFGGKLLMMAGAVILLMTGLRFVIHPEWKRFLWVSMCVELSMVFAVLVGCFWKASTLPGKKRDTKKNR